MNCLKVILVRHSFSTYNQQGRYQGCSDESVLTTKGLEAAYQTGLALKDYQFDAIYSSPLRRVQQTTQEILKVLPNYQQGAIILDNRLKEINMFPWEGLTYEYVKNNLTEAYQCWSKTPHLFNFYLEGNAFFPVLELYHRAKLFWQDIQLEQSAKTILIVAHGGTNRALISTALGLSPDKYHSWQQSNCGISYLEFNQFKYVSLSKFNYTLHLGEKLPKLKEGQQGLRYLFMTKESKNVNNLLAYLKLNDIQLTEKENKLSVNYCQNILTNHQEINNLLEEEFLLNIKDDCLYIIHSPTEDKRILQGILPISGNK